MKASQLQATSWRTFSYKEKHWEGIPAVIDVKVAISSANTLLGLEILDVRFCAVIGGGSCVLGVGCKSAFAELFVFALGGPTAPTVVEQKVQQRREAAVHLKWD